MDMKQNLAALVALIPEGLKFDIEKLGDKYREKPAQTTLISLGAAAFLFYQAERSVNPRVNTIFDALEYCSSSLSVGYSTIFPQTAIGKLVATLLMTFGPAMTDGILRGKHRGGVLEANVASQEKMVKVLEEILVELRGKK